MAFQIDVLTIFPDFFEGPLEESLVKRARQNGRVEIRIHNLRDHTRDRHKTVDDKPFGGGPGMVMKPEPIFECVEALQAKEKKPGLKSAGGLGWVVLLDAGGESLTPKLAKELSRRKRLILICGHYEGVDYRVQERLADQVVSVGDFVTMGGEAPALCLMEAVIRFVPGVLGNRDSLKEESFQHGYLEYPQYTRPRKFRGWEVPEILASGNHREVEKWRQTVSRQITRKKRPDLMEKITLIKKETNL